MTRKPRPRRMNVQELREASITFVGWEGEVAIRWKDGHPVAEIHDSGMLIDEYHFLDPQASTSPTLEN